MIEIGDNVTIADHVSFITHDNSISKVLKDKSDLFGKIIIGNNCFIGAHSVIMYGIQLADNTIVASGSVVTKSFSEPNTIIGGNPAKVISNWNSFAKKNTKTAANIKGLSKKEKENMLLSGEFPLIQR